MYYNEYRLVITFSHKLSLKNEFSNHPIKYNITLYTKASFQLNAPPLGLQNTPHNKMIANLENINERLNELILE